MSNGEAFKENERPNPTDVGGELVNYDQGGVIEHLPITRAPMSTPALAAHTCKATPPNMIAEPRTRAVRRPNPSEARGVSGIL